MSQPDPTTIAADEVAVQAVIGHHAQLAAGLTERVEALVRRVETDQLRTAQTAREDLLAFLRREVLPHARAEEQALYPPAAAHPDGRLLVEGMLAEHAALTALVEELAAASSPVRAATAARALAALFAVHLAKENDLVLPLLVTTPGVSVAGVLSGMHDLLGAAAGHHEPTGAAPQPAGCGGACGCGGDRGSSAAAAPVLTVDARLDVRDLPHDRRHAVVLSTVAALPPGEAVVLIAPHAPPTRPGRGRPTVRPPGALPVAAVRPGRMAGAPGTRHPLHRR